MKSNNHSSILNLTYGALFTALVCVATMVIRVPSFGPSGYVNIGDCMVLISAWLLGGWYGALAAGLGSALADLLAGYAMYVPGTFIIKFLMAVAAFLIFKAISAKLPKTFGYIVSAVVAEAIMILGYLIYESIFLGYGAGAVPAVASNSIQGVMNLAIALVVVHALNASRSAVAYMRN